MKHILTLIILITCTVFRIYAQCTGTQLNWINPSFEGTPATPHVTPPNWDICQPGVTPDTQPGCWGVTLAPTNGSSYVGFCNQNSGNWHEGCGQALSSPMVVGTTYTFTVDIATTASTQGGLTPGCIELQVWGNMGGNSGCDMSYLCWSSGDVFNAAHMDQWVTHTISFTATQPWTNLLFMSNNLGCADCPYIMIDNLTPVQPISDIPQFTWTNVCQGSTMQFTDQSTSSSGTITTWDYDWGDATAHGNTQNPSHLYSAPGTYNVTLTITSTVPCTTTVSHQVVVNPLPTISITPATSSVCSGTGVALTASGGASYSWSPPTGLSSATVANPTASPTANTTYTVTGTDANGCSSTASCTVNISPNLTPTITTVGATCGTNNGSATVTQAGLNYSWSNSQTTQTAVNLVAGNYTVTVTDANGCSGTASCVISNTQGGSATASSTDEYCGLSNGTASASPVGGTVPYTYLWSNSLTTQNISNLPAGTYTVTVTDANLCSASASVTITNIPGGTVSATSTDENCGHANGTASASPAGGTPPYTYLWSNSQTTQNITNLPANTYTVTMTDANGCTAFASATVTNIAGPSLLVLSWVDETCTYGNGSATVNAINGLAPYSYLWSNGDNTATTTNLHAGTYTCTVTDANNCTAMNTVTITDTPGPTISLGGISMASCGLSDGSVTMNVNGGLQPYTYNWNSNPPQSTPNLQNVPTGIYCITVSDANGCSATNCINIGEKPGPSATSSSQNEICDQTNGSATVNPSGGTPPYTYLWSNGQTTQTATGLAQGSYTVTVSDQGCSTVLGVGVLETPGPDAGFSAHPKVLTIMDGPVSFLDNSSGNVVGWNWNFGDGSSGSGEEVDHPYQNIGTYVVTLIITDNNGCMDTIIDTIKVKDIFTFYIPTAFSPNADGTNDFFAPQGVNVDPNNFEMYIFDRWGKEIFQTTTWDAVLNRSEAWNGTTDNRGTYKDVVMDVYVYRIKVKEIDGPKHEYVGRISLIP